MANQKMSPTQMVGARENTMFPHTVVGTLPDYLSCLAVSCERNDRNHRENADQSDGHHNPGPASVHRAFVRIPTMPVTIR
jgi:hypothetical protein